MKTLWLGVLALIYAGCSTVRPCETSRQCDSGDVCAASRCQELSCGQPLFLQDPETGRCQPLSGCFLTDEQRDWPSCPDAEPCQALSEASCLADARCQPIYVLDRSGDAVRETCRAEAPRAPMGASLPNQNRLVHPPMTCKEPAQRDYAGCRLVPELPAPCSALDEETCATRQDCEWGPIAINTGREESLACLERRPMRVSDCSFATSDRGAFEIGCLLNPRCQPTGTACYCPPGAACPCSGGDFVACEYNDRLIRCHSDGDCASGQFCRTRFDCPIERTGLITVNPYSTSCFGVCASDSCGGLDEASCSARDDCFAVYGTECSSTVRGYYQTCPLNPAGSVLGGCLCDNVFQRCATQSPIVEAGATIRSERSLLVRDPAIVSDEAFRFDTVLKSLVKPGDEDAVLNHWLLSFSSNQTLSSGVTAKGREQVPYLWQGAWPPTMQWLVEKWHTTALINRIDLMAPGTCGEARISFAYNGGYENPSQRMTVIVELKVPDDGQGCKLAAARWLELSAIDDPAERLSRLKTLYGALLRPEHLGQVRSNEFINPQRSVPWELREWHLVDGDLLLAAARQAVNTSVSGSAELGRWVADNLSAIQDGTVEVPTSMLAPAVTADGRSLRVPGSRQDRTLRDAETALNKLNCAGCHLGATGTPFVHIGERLAHAQLPAPSGRAVVSEFLFSELPKRATILLAVSQGRASLQAMRRVSSLRVH